MPDGRRYWCGEICIEEYKLRGDWNHLRDHIIERDKVCAICGGQRYTPQRAGYVARGRPWAMFWGPYTPVRLGWEVDHILPVSEGGTDDPRNLRLLCVRCHHDVTALWRREKADGPQISLLV